MITTRNHTSTSETLPPVDCTPWCVGATGHQDVQHPEDQCCVSRDHRIKLSRYPLLEHGDGVHGRD